MAKVVIRKFGGPKAGMPGTAVTRKRVRDAGSGQVLTVLTIDAQSKTLIMSSAGMSPGRAARTWP